MILKHEPLDFYINLLNSGTPFSLARYGDGEFNCIWGRGSQNSNGCLYTPELREELESSLWKFRVRKNFYYGLQRLLPGDMRAVEKFVPKDFTFYDSEIFADTLAVGGLYPFIEALKKKEIVIIGNEALLKTKRLFPKSLFIKIPWKNAYDEKGILEEIIGINSPKVYLFAAGMAATAFVSKLHGKIPGATLIDIGHILDPYCGILSRFYLENLKEDLIIKNYQP